MFLAVSVTFEEAAFGCIKEILIPGAISCEECAGTGGKGGATPQRCLQCHGSGEVRSQAADPGSESCSLCGGLGHTISDPCTMCRGFGHTRRQRNVELRIPPGVDNGTKLRLRGEGEVLRGGVQGDLDVLISVEDHERLRRDGNNVLCQVEIGFAEAILGARINVPTLDGAVVMKVRPGTQSGAVYRFNGKGVLDLHGHGVGDQLTTILVVTPTSVTPRQRELLEEFLEISGEDLTQFRASRRFFDKVREIFG